MYRGKDPPTLPFSRKRVLLDLRVSTQVLRTFACVVVERFLTQQYEAIDSKSS